MGQSVSSPSTPAYTAEDLRAQAIAAGDLRRAYSEQSQAAYRDRRGSEAKRLSELAKAQWAEAERLNGLAAEVVFANHNPSYPSSSAIAQQRRGLLASCLWWGNALRETKVKNGLQNLDLHGLYVAEAIKRVEAHLRACKEWQVEKTQVITGRGAHSVGGLAKIKPSVERWLRERPGKYRVVKGTNEGAVIVELVDETSGLIRGVLSIFGL
jgi:hypothetical protein